jgi:uncharacterized protein
MKALAIDGGGIRGLIPALVLAEIEHRTGRAIATMVDVIAGTSTGAIIACALAKPDAMRASRIADIYVQDGPKIFDASLLRRIVTADGYINELYSDKGLMTSLKTHLGDAKLSQATTRTLITTYDLQSRSELLLRSDRDDVSLVDAARASSAAPSYFEPLRLGDRTLIDGGVGAINPALYAYAEAGGKPTLLLSLGTGSQTKPLPYDEVKDWGKLEWAAPILDVVFDANADAVDSQLDRLIDGSYIRLQTRLTEASGALDDASAENLAALRHEAEKLIAVRSADIDRACALLTE